MAAFLVDANLAPGLAARLRAAGYDCLHVSQFLPADAPDTEISATVNARGAVLITKDADFLDLRRRGVLRGGLVHLRSGNMSNRATAALLLSVLPQITRAIDMGETEFEVR